MTSDSSLSAPIDKTTHRYRKRGKEKKRSKSEGNQNLPSIIPSSSEPLENVGMYKGAPLVS